MTRLGQGCELNKLMKCQSSIRSTGSLPIEGDVVCGQRYRTMRGAEESCWRKRVLRGTARAALGPRLGLTRLTIIKGSEDRLGGSGFCAMLRMSKVLVVAVQ